MNTVERSFDLRRFLVFVGVTISALVVLLIRPLGLLAVLVNPLGPGLLSAFFVCWVALALYTFGVFQRLSSLNRFVLPGSLFGAFALTLLAVTTPAQKLITDLFGVTPSIQMSFEAPSHLLLIVTDDFGGNFAPRPDSMTLIDLSQVDQISLTPILRDWTQSLSEPSQSLALKHFELSDCEPYCELKDLVARIALEEGGIEFGGLSKASELVSTVISKELEIENLATIELNPSMLAEFLERLGPLEVEVKEPIPVGGLWVDERMTQVRYYIPAGLRILGAEEAVWYARARWGSSNEDRTRRQLELIQAAAEQYPSSEIALALFGGAGARSNLSQNQLAHLIWNANGYLERQLIKNSPVGKK